MRCSPSRTAPWSRTPPRNRSPTARSPRRATAAVSWATSRWSRSSRTAPRAAPPGRASSGCAARSRSWRRAAPLPISRSTESSRATPRSWPTSPGARPPARPWRAAPTCSCSPILTAATSPTNWCSAWAAGRRSARSCRAWRDRSPTCRAVPAPTILWTRRRSRFFKRRSTHELQPAEGQARGDGRRRGRAADRRQPPGAQAEGARLPGRRRAQVRHRLHEDRLHRLLGARRARLPVQEDQRAGRRPAAGRAERGPADPVRAHQARHALRHRQDSRGSARRVLSARDHAVAARGSPARGRVRCGDDARRAERPRVRGPGGRAHRPACPRFPVAPAHPLQPAHGPGRSARQRHRVRQSARHLPGRARPGRSGPAGRAHPRAGRRRGVRPGRGPGSHAAPEPGARGRARAVRAAPSRRSRRLQRRGERNLPDAASGLSHLERTLPALERLSGARLRVWRRERGIATLVAGALVDWTLAAEPDGGRAGGHVETPEGKAWFEPVPGMDGVWLEIGGKRRRGKREGPPLPTAGELAEIVGSLLAAERETAHVAAELSERYEEIDLIYTISEILGHTIRLDEAAQRILTEVSTVVGARRATLLVLDPAQQVLRVVAARGMDRKDVDPIEVDDPCSIAARVFRERRIVSYDPTDPKAVSPGCPEGRNYRGRAFLSVPVLYAAPGTRGKQIGVINLTDRLGEDAFTAGDRKLVAAIANQIGAAVENARLVAQDLSQQRVRRELELAHDLQLKLLPSPLVLAARADVAARCRQAESVGGDFYNLLNLRGDRLGVMIGDVTSHGFSAALIMALVMAASGIHAETAETPAEVLRRIEESLGEELASTEMFLTVFYAVIDPAAQRIVYANAGHPHAFLVSTQTGDAVRLEATRPPLGLATAPGEDAVRPWRRREALLCLFTDGLTEATGSGGAGTGAGGA